MSTTKLPVFQIIAVCAVVGCGVLGFTTLLELGRAQELQRKLKDADAELKFVHMVPGWKQTFQATKENPERLKRTEETFQRLPAMMQERRDAAFQTKLSNVQERLKLELPAGEFHLLKDMTNVLTQAHEVELNPMDMLSMSSQEKVEATLANGQARQAVAQLRQRYIDIRLEQLAREMGQESDKQEKKFVDAVKQIYADTESMLGPPIFTYTPPKKPWTPTQ